MRSGGRPVPSESHCHLLWQVLSLAFASRRTYDPRVPHLTLLQGGQRNSRPPGFAPFDEERVRAEFLEDWYAVHDRDPGESVINLWVETRQIEYEAAAMGAPIEGKSSPPKLSVVY